MLTDNGKVFTGRFHKPGVPVEVLFDRICRENGITHRLTKIHSPTTTGKIERLHQTLQRELLDVHGPFASIEALQAALDAWRQEYNTDRPHQSLAMAFPASRFTPASSSLELRIPAQLTAPTTGSRSHRQPSPGPLPAQSLPAERSHQRHPRNGLPAVEVDRVVPASGNLQLGGQQVWLGPALSGRRVTLWADAISLHVLLDGARIKTLPSRLGVTELARLAANGARPAGPSPLPAGDWGGDRGGPHRQRHRPGQPGRPAGRRRLAAGRAAGHAAHGRTPDGRPRLTTEACCAPWPAPSRPPAATGCAAPAAPGPCRPSPAAPSPCSGGSPPGAGSWSPGRRSTPG